MKLTDIEQVQKRVGRLPAPRDLKVIDYLDEHAARWLSYTNFAFIAFGTPGDLSLSAAGGESGFVAAPTAKQLLLPLAALDDANMVAQGLSFGALFVVGGMDETLRVNGKVSRVADRQAILDVEECYLHCAKSLRRGSFWSPQSITQTHGDSADFIERSTFLVLASINRSGQADVSPKGDRVHFLLHQDNGRICIADRPGNRRIDSFRNIIEQPEVALMAVVPGCWDILEFQGTAELCTDDGLLQRFEVEGNRPNLITRIAPAAMRIRSSAAITKSALWPAGERPRDLQPSEIFKAHMKQSNDRSLQAKLARVAVSLPGAMELGLEFDYKTNLY